MSAWGNLANQTKKNQKVLGSAERPSLSKYAGEQSSNLEETQHPL